MKIGVLTFFFLIISFSIISGQDGILDNTFSGDGIVMMNFGNNDYGNSIAVQPDGKVVITGTCNMGGGVLKFGLCRYKNDGSIDTEFGTNGKVTTSVGFYAFAQGVVLQPDGKILVGGYANFQCQYNPSRNGLSYALARYNQDGTLDNDFGTGGIVKDDYAGCFENLNIQGIALKEDGQIVIAGNDEYDMINISRFKGNGDSGWGSESGENYFSAGEGNEMRSVAIQTDGKIIAAGTSNNDFLLVRLNSDFSRDNGFGNNGVVLASAGAGTNDYALGAAIQADGKIVAAGGTDDGVAVMRFNTDGSLDMGFGSNGKVVTGIGSNDYGSSIAVLSDGKILVGGNAMIDDVNNLVTIRYTINGALDTDYGDDGVASVPFAGETYGTGIAVQADGKVIITGYTMTEDGYDFVAARFSGSIPPMPVELTSFNAEKIDNGVELKWSTATEVNNYGFEIQRSLVNSHQSLANESNPHSDCPYGKISNQQWELVGFVEGSGNSNSPKYYSFVDGNPPAGDLQYRIKQIDTDGSFEYYQEIAEVNYSLTGVSEIQLPKEFALEQNYPNPFNPSTVIRYQLPVNGYVELKVYDVMGNEITTLVNETKAAGCYKVKFDGSNLSSGMYIYRLCTGNFTQNRKLILVK